MTVHPIDLEFQGLSRAIASFLVEGPRGFILIEPGPESCRGALLGALQRINVKPESMAAVFVTHIHLDHAGGAGWWAERGIPVHVHPKGVRHLIDPSRLEASARRIYGDRFDDLWGPMVPAPGSSVVTLNDGQRVEIAGLTVEAIETPGHCFHHHAYAIEEAIFTGDAAGAAVDESGHVSVTSAPPQFDLECTLSSLERLAARNASTLYLTHFGSVENPAAHLDAYREAVELNALFIRQRMEEGMDAESLRVAYEAFQMEQAFRAQVSQGAWATLQQVNGTGMCADGIRLYWEKLAEDQA